MVLQDHWKRLGERVVPGSYQATRSLLFAALYLGGMIVLITVPLQLFIRVGTRFGTEVGGVVHLSSWGGWLLLLLVAATFGWSIVVGGFGSALLTNKHIHWLLLAFLGLGLLFGLAGMFNLMRDAVRPFSSVQGGDNLKLSSFITFWILMVGYAGKAVWDEPRNRLARRMNDWFPEKDSEKPAVCGCTRDSTGE